MNDSNIKKSSFFRKLFEKKEADSMPSEGTKLSLEQEKQSLKEENERLRAAMLEQRLESKNTRQALTIWAPDRTAPDRTA